MPADLKQLAHAVHALGNLVPETSGSTWHRRVAESPYLRLSAPEHSPKPFAVSIMLGYRLPTSHFAARRSMTSSSRSQVSST